LLLRCHHHLLVRSSCWRVSIRTQVFAAPCCYLLAAVFERAVEGWRDERSQVSIVGPGPGLMWNLTVLTRCGVLLETIHSTPQKALNTR
jgi:hypothetical protein